MISLFSFLLQGDVMSNNHKDEQWIFFKDIEGEIAGPGIIRKVLAYGDNAMCVVNEFEEGAIGPVHSHAEHTQITYVAEGRFRFSIGDVEKEVSKGDTLFKKPDVKHGCVCLEKGSLIDFFTPMREDFVK
jgi:quercetin dioxygenase-like cupin family protein